MASLDKQLIRREDGLALLFAPPFDKTTHDPGYIKGYPPGVRENGGQYTHAAAWSVMAFAALGEGDKAAELFSLLNPINHSRNRADAYRYKVEPYVACADIYSTVAACRARGLDLVHGLGRLAAARGGREPARSAIPRSVLVCRSVHSQGLGQIRGDGEISNCAILDFRREPERGQSGCALRGGRRSRDLRTSRSSWRSWMMGVGTRSTCDLADSRGSTAKWKLGGAGWRIFLPSGRSDPERPLGRRAATRVATALREFTQSHRAHILRLKDWRR